MKNSLVMIALLFGTVGCVHLQPVGPMAKMMKPGHPQERVQQAKPVEAAPIITSAPPPPPPSLLVAPGEVGSDNHRDAIKRLTEELESDRKAIETMPRYSEVSVVK